MEVPTVRQSVRVSYVIARLERAMRVRIAAAVAPHGLTVPQYTTLSVMRDREGLSNAQLARRSYVTRQSMGEVIRGLEEAGLIERRPHPDHRRTLRTAITPEGNRILAACDADVSEIEEQMLSGLSADQRGDVFAALTAAVHNLGAGQLDL